MARGRLTQVPDALRTKEGIGSLMLAGAAADA